MTNVESMDYRHSHPSTLGSLSSTAHLSLLGKGLSIGLILMAHQVSSAPLLYTNGAPVARAPLVWKTLMAHRAHGAPLLLIFFPFFQTN